MIITFLVSIVVVVASYCLGNWLMQSFDDDIITKALHSFLGLFLLAIAGVIFAFTFFSIKILTCN